MPSRFLDADAARKLAEHRYDFGRKTLGGRVVLVAGGTGGLGAAVVALLLLEGALPVVGYRSNRGRALALQQRLQDVYGGLVTLVEGDIHDPLTRHRYLDAALNLKNEIYGLVALSGDPVRANPSEWEAGALLASVASNFEAPILLARGAAEAMLLKGTRGSIVLVSSVMGVHPFEGSLAYAGPKAALVHGALILAKEYGGASDVRVNVVAPGPIAAGISRASVESGRYDPYVEGGAIHRFGRPEDVAKAVRFLLEPDSFVTGQVVTVDGGLSLRRDRLAPL